MDNHGQFTPQAKREFLDCADPWLIAKAKAHNMIVVTHEKSSPESKKRIFIPDICKECGVEYCSTMDLMRALGARI